MLKAVVQLWSGCMSQQTGDKLMEQRRHMSRTPQSVHIFDCRKQRITCWFDDSLQSGVRLACGPINYTALFTTIIKIIIKKNLTVYIIVRLSHTHYMWKLCVHIFVLKLMISDTGKAWGAARKVSKDDWLEWLRRLSVVLLKESSSPALRSCWSLAQTYIPLAR